MYLFYLNTLLIFKVYLFFAKVYPYIANISLGSSKTNSYMRT